MFFEDKIQIKNTTKGKLPSLPFEDIKNEVLGKKYDLSLVFVGDKLSKKINKEYRGKDKPTNILSFPLSKSEGEIFINLTLSKKQAKNFERASDKFIGFLLIHGLMHLKGFQHSSRMESKEHEVRIKFGL